MLVVRIILGIAILFLVVSAILCFREYKHFDYNDGSMLKKGIYSLRGAGILFLIFILSLIFNLI